MYARYQQFKTSIAWYGIESTAYQCLYLIHHYFLFNTVPAAIYQQTTYTLALIYLTVDVINLGLDASLMPFYQYWSAGSANLKKFFLSQLPINIFVLTIIITFWYTHYATQSYTLCVLIILLMYVEPIRRSCKLIAQQNFYIRTVALIDFSSLLCYLLLTWGYVIRTYYEEITSAHIIAPLVISTIYATIGYLLCMGHWYVTIPQQSTALPMPQKQILNNRVYSFLHHLTHMAFSSNAIIPFARHYIPEYNHAIFSFITQNIQSFVTIIYKTIAPSISALFAHIQNDSTEEKRLFFRKVQFLIYGIVASFILFNIGYIHYLFTYAHVAHINIICYVIMIHICHTILMLYEKWYNMQHRTEELFWITSITFVTVCGGLTYWFGIKHIISYVVLSHIISLIIIRVRRP